MRFQTTISLLVGIAGTSITLANPLGGTKNHRRNVEHSSISSSSSTSTSPNPLSKRHNNFFPDPAEYPATPPINPPKVFAMLLFPTFDMIDVFGPLDALNILSKSWDMTLYLVADTMDPVSTAPLSLNDKNNPKNSSFFPTINPTHTFANVPSDEIDVVIVPGGPGVRQESGTQQARDWLTSAFGAENPSRPDHLITICTGSGLVAQTGLLDGKRATTNKFGWSTITAMGPNVTWVSPARWVRDGNFWSSSGVTAGIDLTFEFIRSEFNAFNATRVSGIIEHDIRGSEDDGWAEKWRVEPTGGDNDESNLTDGAGCNPRPATSIISTTVSSPEETGTGYD